MAVTAIVVGASGSTPRGSGAMMVLGKGRIRGTIGGGCVERQIFGHALHMLDNGGSRSLSVNLAMSPDLGSEMICGGKMEMLLLSWSREDLETVSEVRSALEERRPAILITLIKGEKISRIVADPADLPLKEIRRLEINDLESLVRKADCTGDLLYITDAGGAICIEPMLPPNSLILAGAGHIAHPLAAIARMLGFHITIIDDMEYYARPERFPMADRVIAGNFHEVLSGLHIDRRSYIVLLTRGHRCDEECLRALMASSPAYIGMIGSRLRVRVVVEKLMEEGFTGFEKLHAPVGIDIGAETPEEIALCISAEMIMVMRGGTGRSLRENLSRKDQSHPSSQEGPKEAQSRSGQSLEILISTAQGGESTLKSTSERCRQCMK